MGQGESLDGLEPDCCLTTAGRIVLHDPILGLSLVSGVCDSVAIARRVMTCGPAGFSSDHLHELRAVLADTEPGRSPPVHPTDRRTG